MRNLPYRMLIPFFGISVVFWLIPLIQGFLMSLQANTMLGQGEFVGFQHYLHLLEDARYQKAVFNTFFQAFASILTVVPLAFVIAVLISLQLQHLRSFFRFFLLLPGLAAPSVLALLFLFVFNGPYGYLNRSVLEPLGIPTMDWMRHPLGIRLALIFQTVWRWSGFIALFLLASLEQIPKMYYEAGRLEGMSLIQQHWSISLPLMKKSLIFVSLFLLLDAFSLFSGAYVLLGGEGGPDDAGLLLVSYSYQMAFTFGRFESAAAVGFSIIPMIVSVFWLLLWRRIR